MHKLTQKEIMIKQRKKFMTYLVKGIALALVLLAAITSDAQESLNGHKCRDMELEVACKTAIEAADELLQQKDAKALYLEEMLKMQLSQNEMQSKFMLELTNPPWYRDYRYTFLIGIIVGGVIHGTTNR